MADGIVTLPRAGTVEIIQEFGGAPAAPALPTPPPPPTCHAGHPAGPDGCGRAASRDDLRDAPRFGDGLHGDVVRGDLAHAVGCRRARPSAAARDVFLRPVPDVRLPGA